MRCREMQFKRFRHDGNRRAWKQAQQHETNRSNVPGHGYSHVLSPVLFEGHLQIQTEASAPRIALEFHLDSLYGFLRGKQIFYARQDPPKLGASVLAALTVR